MNYEELHQQYYRKVLAYLQKIVGRPDAEDLTQEVFVKADQNLHTLRDSSRVAPWIFRIALNSARDALRKRGPTRVHYGETVNEVADCRAGSPEERLQRSEMIHCYLDFVRKLPAHYYEVYVMSDLEGLQDQSISTKLQLPLETVKMRLHRARTKLYETLRSHCRCYVSDHGRLMGTLK